MNPPALTALRNRFKTRLPRAYATVRSVAKRVTRPARRLALAVDPTPAIAARRVESRPFPGDLACIYRAQHAALVAELVDQALGAGLVPRLWALDREQPGLAAFTVGHGAGGRGALLNSLLSGRTNSSSCIVLADDDFEFRRGTLSTMLALGAAAALDVFQPAHDGRSHRSHDFVLGLPGSLVRKTSFVEIGPIVAMQPGAARLLLPFPEDSGMGWGEDFRWARTIEAEHLSAGIVDAVRIRHIAPPATDYDPAPELARRAASLDLHGYADSDDAQHLLGTWPAWRRKPTF